MIDDEVLRKNLFTLIPKILGEEENLKSFALFLNKLENIRRPLLEIKSVLEDYLLICNNKPLKGKKRIKHITDRQLLHWEKNVGFLNADKIIMIGNAVLEKSGIKAQIGIHEFKRKYKKNILRNDDFGKTYKDLMVQHREGDEIFELISPRWTWKQLCGHSFVALERKGEAVVVIRKSMN